MTERKTTCPKFLVERFGYGEDIQHIIDEIEKQGYKCKCPKYVPFEGGEYNQYADDECVVFFGSLNLARELSRKKPWVPGPFCNLQNFKCSTYYAHWYKFMWNRFFVMVPLAYAAHHFDMLHSMLHANHEEDELTDGDAVFIRPDDGFKTFTGQVISRRTAASDFSYLSSRSKPETLCVVSCCDPPEKEWRIFCRERTILSGSQYREGHRLETTEVAGIPDDVRSYLQNVLNEVQWFPEKLFVADVGFSATRGHAIIELNSFSCSGFYKCDPAPIIQAAAEVALAEWEDINNI